MHRTRVILFLLLAALWAPAKAHALAGDWQRDEAVTVRLISGVNGVGQLAMIPLGLDIQLAPGWHTYWRSPGEAGMPPALDWKESLSESGNLKSATLLYPAPRRTSAFGLDTIGYSDHVVFPIDAVVQAPGRVLRGDVALDLLVCSDICVPKHFTLSLTVPESEASESAEAALIRHYRDLVPGDAEKSGLAIKNVVRDANSVVIDVAARASLQAPDAFVEDDDKIFFTAPVVTIAPDKHSAQFYIKPTDPLPAGTDLAKVPLTLTIVDGDHALEQNIAAPATITAHENAPAPITSSLPIGLVILLALLGGFILNLMPCVLPVLSLKVLGVISHGGGEPRTVRHSFLMTAGGIVFSYLALAGMTVALKQAGLAVGWGVQFQQPLFLISLILLLTFFAATMWDLFVIRLPRWLADNLTGPYHPKLAGDFATGAFATLLATPCSAPFLGTAIGFALAAGPREIFIVFAALGCGMALPYLLIALLPRFATALPKPGAWMVHLRHLLGLALAATAIWLIWVLAAQIAAANAFVVALSMIAIWGLLALRRRDPSRYRLSFGVIAFMLLAFGTTLAGSLASKPVAAIDSAWSPFDESAIAGLVAQGDTVFIDVTADWCLTCKANQKFVLARDEIRQRLFAPGIVAMQADWTSPDPVIAAFLEKHGRYGIPFNAVFGPGAPQGLVLPELLTPQKVLAALEEAGKAPQP